LNIAYPVDIMEKTDPRPVVISRSSSKSTVRVRKHTLVSTSLASLTHFTEISVQLFKVSTQRYIALI